MYICKKRIRNIGRYVRNFRTGQQIILSIAVNQIEPGILQKIGFSDKLEPGETVLPSPIGPISDFNASGKDIVHKDQDMETVYRQSEWKWNEFRGRDNTVEMSKIVDVPYKRYPRTFIKPPSIELRLSTDNNGNLLVISPTLEYKKENENVLLHVVNLFLEIFNICEIRNNKLESIIKSPVKRLNWEILPKGRQPWEKLKVILDEFRESTAEGNKAVIDKRFESINIHNPDFVALGKAGFSGYVVFGFSDKNLFMLESNQTNNATYIFEDNWEHLSALSKAEILSKNLHKDRIIHREGWFNEINRVLH
jgi:hypothetical protein